jgi:hypothetical protein
MAIVLDGATGITSPGGDSAAVSVTTPLVTNAGTLALSATGANIVTASTNGTERMRIDSAGNVGIGTSSPSQRLHVNNGAIVAGNSGDVLIGRNSSTFPTSGAGYFRIKTNNLDGLNGGISFDTLVNGTLSESMRIDSSGNLLVGTTSSLQASVSNTLQVKGAADLNIAYFQVSTNDRSIVFRNASNVTSGTITIGASTTTYATSSDYRLKHDIQPMTGALAKVAQLKPVTYKWNADDSQSQGFIAHELQEVVPECVTGEKDAVDAEGNPQYQGIDTSFLVATLTAALQEAVAEINSLKARVEALEGAQIV